MIHYARSSSRQIGHRALPSRSSPPSFSYRSPRHTMSLPRPGLPDWATVQLSHGFTHSRYARHVRIEQPSHSIKGRYAIGPAAVDHWPPLFDLPAEEVVRKSSSSASFETRSSAIAVEVWIMGDDYELNSGTEKSCNSENSEHCKGDNPGRLSPINEAQGTDLKEGHLVSRTKPVNLAAKSYFGRIQMSIPQYMTACPLHIRARSYGGSIYIFLPPTFSGLISWKADSGSLRLSNAVCKRYMALGELFKHRGIGMLLPRGHKRNPTYEQAAESATVALEQTRLHQRQRDNDMYEMQDLQHSYPHRSQQRSRSVDSADTQGTDTPTSSLSAASSVEDLSSCDVGSLASPASSAPTSPTLVSAAGASELNFSGAAAATAASVRGTAIRGDACELVTRTGSIHIFEVGEQPVSEGPVQDCCVVA